MQVTMEWGIFPGEMPGIHKRLQATNRCLGQVGTVRGIGWVAKVNSTTQRSGLPRGASPMIILPRARRPFIKRPNRGRGVGQEDGELGGRHEQGMVVLDEPTAATTDLANRRQGGDFGIERLVNRLNLHPKLHWVKFHDW